MRWLRLMARVIGVGVETADMLVHESWRAACAIAARWRAMPGSGAHSAIRSLRASATIIVLRVAFLRPSAVRASNHWTRALSFWKRRKRPASWIMPCRTRALPARASPFSRRHLPLSSGDPSSPWARRHRASACVRRDGARGRRRVTHTPIG